MEVRCGAVVRIYTMIWQRTDVISIIRVVPVEVLVRVPVRLCVKIGAISILLILISMGIAMVNPSRSRDVIYIMVILYLERWILNRIGSQQANDTSYVRRRQSVATNVYTAI